MGSRDGEELGAGAIGVDAQRRSFLCAMGGMLGGMVLAPGLATLRAAAPRRAVGAAPWLAGARRLDSIGIQLYTVRHLMERDAAGTLKKLAGIGYREVELAGLYGKSAPAMRELLDRSHLAAPSGHIGTMEMRGDWARTLADANTLGHRYITCAWIDQSERTVDGYRRIAELLNRSGEAARAAGLQLCYHNHDFEFTRVDDVVPYDLLLSACDPTLVKMEMDIYWLVKGGRDPIRYLEAHPDRFPLVHVKDMNAGGEMVDVGRGVIDFRSIFRHSDDAGIRHYFVEHDEPRDPLQTARASHDYLRRLEF